MTVLTFSSRVSGTERQLDANRGRLVICHPDELRPHPSYIRHNLTVHACQLSAVTELGDRVFRELLVITQDHMILDGFARWALASGEPKAARAGPAAAWPRGKMSRSESTACR